jgi:hypothetical protein
MGDAVGQLCAVCGRQSRAPLTVTLCKDSVGPFPECCDATAASPPVVPPPVLLLLSHVSRSFP